METILPVENETLLEIERLTNLRFETVRATADQTSYSCYSVRVYLVDDNGTRTRLYLCGKSLSRHISVPTKDCAEAGLVEMLSSGEYEYVRFPRLDEQSNAMNIPVNIGLPTFYTVDEIKMKLKLMGAR